jgi:hypothetical protein
MHHIHRGGVTGHSVSVFVGSDSEKFINLILVKPLQPEALSGSQTADTRIRHHHALFSVGINRMSYIAPDPSAPRITGGIA